MKRDILVIEPGQIRRLSKTVAEAYSTVIYVLAYGGIRWGEAVALTRARCDLLRSRLDISDSASETADGLHFGPTKNYARRWARLPRFVADMLADHLTSVSPELDALVFTAPGGGPLCYNNFRSRVWNPAVQRLGTNCLWA